MDELDRVVADIEAKRREKLDHADWRPVNLSAVLSGERLDPEPSILRRSDEVALFYPAKVNLVYGEPESAKGWLVLAACTEQMADGEPVLYIDFEDSATGIVGRRATSARAESRSPVCSSTSGPTHRPMRRWWPTFPASAARSRSSTASPRQ